MIRIIEEGGFGREKREDRKGKMGVGFEGAAKPRKS
jgi:hypothetical protein